MTSDSASGPAGNAAEGMASAERSMRLQILSTEHWSLRASRSFAWNESFTRAGMFLSTLSGVMVALALVAQASAFGNAFALFALVILPVALFVGLTTFLRLDGSNYHDAQCVIGMNRIRGAYLELAPDLEPYFVMSAHDDSRGLGITMAAGPNPGTPAHILAGTPTLISVLNSVLVGVILGLLSVQLAILPVVALGLAIVGLVVSMAAHAMYGRQSIMRGQKNLRPLFPTP
jgi:hypothetical protein